MPDSELSDKSIYLNTQQRQQTHDHNATTGRLPHAHSTPTYLSAVMSVIVSGIVPVKWHVRSMKNLFDCEGQTSTRIRPRLAPPPLRACVPHRAPPATKRQSQRITVLVRHPLQGTDGLWQLPTMDQLVVGHLNLPATGANRDAQGDVRHKHQ